MGVLTEADATGATEPIEGIPDERPLRQNGVGLEGDPELLRQLLMDIPDPPAVPGFQDGVEYKAVDGLDLFLRRKSVMRGVVENRSHGCGSPRAISAG